MSVQDDLSQSMPYVEVDLKPDFNQSMLDSIAKLRALGLNYEADEIEKSRLAIVAKQKEFLVNVSARISEKAQQIEREQVGHSASGYVPTGTLRKSIKPSVSDDNTIATVSAAAQAKDGYLYGNAVEFGTYKQAAEPFLGPALNETQQDNENDSSKFLKEGVEQIE